MAHKILIVDDDKEFSALLRDVFQQADYAVDACISVDQALERLSEAPYDLVVTDYRMPGRSGIDLVDSILSSAPRTPIIMVSGFLENNVIRALISRGVGGIFMKPLNIFSLLKKATELIQKAAQPALEKLSEEGFTNNLPFPFQTFPCKAKQSQDFARKLFELRDFSKNLLLIGNPGVDVDRLCADLIALSDPHDVPIHLTPERVEREALFGALEEAMEKGAEQITFVFTAAESLQPEQCAIIYQLARRKGPFVALTLPKRFVFFLQRDLNHYYDSGIIDEEFYIFLGSTELRIPELDEISEDIPALADSMLEAAVPGKRFEKAAHAFLARHPWPGHMMELRKAVENAANWTARSVVKADDVKAVLGGLPTTGTAQETQLAEYLRERKRAYQQALEKLTPFLSTSPESRDRNG